MVHDTYTWTKKRMELLIKQVDPIRLDNADKSTGKIWSIKKLLMLDYYISSFVKIMNKQEQFTSWYYVDTHCGSGLIDFKEHDLKDQVFPGSPIIVALRNPKYPFTEYHMSDTNGKVIEALKRRLENLKPAVGTESYNPVVRSFEETVNFIESKKKFGRGFLIFVDPVGFKDIEWVLMERLLRIETTDIFFTFMTYGIGRNKANVKKGNTYEKSFNKFFGNSDWNACHDCDKLLELYKQQMQKFKKHVFSIPIFETGERKLYDVIIATKSEGAKNIINDGKKILDSTATEIIKNAYKVLAKKSRNITEYM